jgi:hypothetical protein
MTEAEWLAATNPEPMLEFLRREATHRKLRLFVCACVSQILPLAKLVTDQARVVLEEIELYADGRTTKAAMMNVWEKLSAARGNTQKNTRTVDDDVCDAIADAGRENSYRLALCTTGRLL